MACAEVLRWSERGTDPRHARISHAVKHYAEVGRKATPGGTTKITLRGPQKGTTRRGGQTR